MPLHVHYRWGVALVGKLLYWALLTPSWVNIFQVLKVRSEVSISKDYWGKGRVVVSSYILYYSGPNVQSYDVNDKFCNQNLVSDLFSMV